MIIINTQQATAAAAAAQAPAMPNKFDEEEIKMYSSWTK